jgi:hypothetical protein
MNKSRFFVSSILAQGIVNGRYAAEISADEFYPAGTIVCDSAGPDDGDDITFTFEGKRFLDNGRWTPRESRLGNRDALHLYRLTVCVGDAKNWANQFALEVDARNRTQACAIAARAGYYVGDCNMIG